MGESGLLCDQIRRENGGEIRRRSDRIIPECTAVLCGYVQPAKKRPQRRQKTIYNGIQAAPAESRHDIDPRGGGLLPVSGPDRAGKGRPLSDRGFLEAKYGQEAGDRRR